MDMRKVPSVSDYFVVSSGTSTTQVKAISDNIRRVLREKGEKLWHSEGEREALWIVLDYGDVVAHIFGEETRHFYDLEKLWSDIPQERFREKTGKAVPRRKARVLKKKKKKKRARR